MNITLTDTNGTFSVTLNEDFYTLDEIISLLVKPVLLAASFSEEQLDKYFVKEEEFQIIFNDWTDEDEEEFTKAMEKAVCKKEAATPKEVFSKAPVEKKAVAKMAG
jgi:hypothetical protein